MTEVIIAEGAVPLPALARLQDQLLAGFAAGTAVVLDLSRVMQTDLGLVQLVAAARKYAEAHGASFALAAPATAPIEALLRRAGFLTDPAGENAEFWLHGAVR